MAWFSLLAGVLVFPAFPGPDGRTNTEAQTPTRATAEKNQVHRGMTPDEVRRLWGPPLRISRQFLYRHYVEQWTYDRPPRWLEFHCLRGQEPYVLTVHQSVSSPP